MTPDSLVEECHRAETAGLDHILLVIPHGVRAPWRGELLSETEERGRVYRFPITSIRRWLKRLEKS